MENRPGYSAKTPLPEDALPPTESGVPPRSHGQKQAEKNGHGPAQSSIHARVTHLQPELGVQIVNGEGDNLRQISYKTPEPIPRADPEGRGRTIGQRVDEMIAEAESRAARDYQKALDEQRQA